MYALLNKYRTLCGLRNQMNHAATTEHNSNGFFCYMKKKYNNDSNWKDQKNINYEKRIRTFLNEWEKLANQVPDNVRNQVEDMS